MHACWYMEFEMQLWLRGYMFHGETISIPDYDDRMKWAENLEYRESLIKAAGLKMKSIYHSQIDKCQGKYDIYVIMPSKIEFVPDEENEQTKTELI